MENRHKIGLLAAVVVFMAGGLGINGSQRGKKRSVASSKSQPKAQPKAATKSSTKQARSEQELIAAFESFAKNTPNMVDAFLKKEFADQGYGQLYVHKNGQTDFLNIGQIMTVRSLYAGILKKLSQANDESAYKFWDGNAKSLLKFAEGPAKKSGHQWIKEAPKHLVIAQADGQKSSKGTVSPDTASEVQQIARSTQSETDQINTEAQNLVGRAGGLEARMVELERSKERVRQMGSRLSDETPGSSGYDTAQQELGSVLNQQEAIADQIGREVAEQTEAVGNLAEKINTTSSTGRLLEGEGGAAGGEPQVPSESAAALAGGTSENVQASLQNVGAETQAAANPSLQPAAGAVKKDANILSRAVSGLASAGYAFIWGAPKTVAQVQRVWDEKINGADNTEYKTELIQAAQNLSAAAKEASAAQLDLVAYATKSKPAENAGPNIKEAYAKEVRRLYGILSDKFNVILDDRGAQEKWRQALGNVEVGAAEKDLAASIYLKLLNEGASFDVLVPQAQALMQKKTDWNSIMWKGVDTYRIRDRWDRLYRYVRWSFGQDQINAAPSAPPFEEPAPASKGAELGAGVSAGKARVSGVAAAQQVWAKVSASDKKAAREKAEKAAKEIHQQIKKVIMTQSEIAENAFKKKAQNPATLNETLYNDESDLVTNKQNAWKDALVELNIDDPRSATAGHLFWKFVNEGASWDSIVSNVTDAMAEQGDFTEYMWMGVEQRTKDLWKEVYPYLRWYIQQP